MRPFHRRNADQLRQRIVAATVEAERLTYEADIAAEHGDVSYQLAHEFRMILRALQHVEERARHACDIQMAYEAFETYSNSTFREAS